MTDREYNKRQIEESLIEYLKIRGIECGTEEHPKKFTCLNPSHPDKHPSMSIYRKSDNKLVARCFSCNASYDTFDLIGIDYNISDFKEQYNKACEVLGIGNGTEYKALNKAFDWNDKIGGSKSAALPPKAEKKKEEQPKKDLTEYFNRCHSDFMKITDENLYNRITRGLSVNTLIKFNIGYDAEYNKHKGDEVIMIPHDKYTYNARRLNKEKSEKYGKYDKTKNEDATLFNLDALKQKVIFICEGEYNAMTLIDIGYNALALASTGGADLFLQALKELPVEEREQKDIILNLDNDKAGHKTTEKLEKGLKSLNVPLDIMWFDEGEDANSMLLQGKEEELRAKCYDAVTHRTRTEEYKAQNSANGRLKDFIDRTRNGKTKPPIPTGFDNLDKCLDGGLYKGIYTIGAESSLGKTTFALQIADQIAQNGTDVLIFSLEMPLDSLIAKSVSRLTYKNANDKQSELGESKQAKTLLGVKQGDRYKNYSKDELYLIEKAEKLYSEYADHIYIFEKSEEFTVNEVEKRVKDHIHFTGKAPVILIDYLQLLDSPDSTKNYQERQVVEQNLKALVKLWKKYEIPIILISSMNRGSYAEQVSFSSLKESGLIEFSSDVVIGLQFDIFHNAKLEEVSKNDRGEFRKKLADHERTKFNRDIELKILKNRESRTGDKIQYNYIPMFNYFWEGEIVEQESPEPPKPKKRTTTKSKKATEEETDIYDLLESWEDE